MTTSLSNLREKINILDEQIVCLLSERMNVVAEIGKIKKEQAMPLKDTKQWATVIERVLTKAQEKNLNNEFIKKLYSLIHIYALEQEKEQ